MKNKADGRETSEQVTDTCVPACVSCVEIPKRFIWVTWARMRVRTSAGVLLIKRDDYRKEGLGKRV